MAKIEETERRKASEKLDQVRSKAKKVSTEEILSWIREDRDARH
jgi:hypothetical protein